MLKLKKIFREQVGNCSLLFISLDIDKFVKTVISLSCSFNYDKKFI